MSEYRIPSKSWLDETHGLCRNLFVVADPTALVPRVTQSGRGRDTKKTIIIPAMATGASATTDRPYLCKVTAVSLAGVYSVDLHTSKSEMKVGTGEMEIVNLHPSEFIAVGDWVVGTPFNTKEIVLIDEP